jgi:hypothetical protein
LCAANLESDPEALKVREWRHKLQKTFLSSNKSLPKDDVRRFIVSPWRSLLIHALTAGDARRRHVVHHRRGVSEYEY